MIRPASEPILLLVSNMIVTSVWLKKHLKGVFYVIHETSGKKGLEKLKNTVVDFIILDENIKDSDCLKIASEMKKTISPNWIPILLITSNLKKSFREKAMHAGITDFLTDPLEENELEIRIAISLKIHDMHQKIEQVSKTLQTKDKNLLSQSMITTRFLLNDRAVREVARASKEKKPLVIALIGIDAFRSIEKDYGVLEVDKLLLSLSELLINQVRKNDVLIPSKDGKFILILPNTTLKEAKSIATSLVEEIKKKELGREKEVGVSVSIVLSSQEIFVSDSPDVQFDRMVDHANTAMKKIKRSSTILSLEKRS